jgi:hypothetical protein
MRPLSALELRPPRIRPAPSTSSMPPIAVSQLRQPPAAPTSQLRRMRPLSATAVVAVSVLTPTSSAESPQTLGARNFRLPNRLGHRNRLLCCPQSIAEPLAAVEGFARRPLEKWHGCKKAKTASPTDRRSTEAPQHRSAGRQPRPPKFPPHRRSKRRSVAFRHTEVPLFDTPQFLDRLSFQLRQAQ